MSSKPNLFIIGAPKCGTTAWREYLKNHTDITFCHPKEPHHFCEDFPGFRWSKTKEEYTELFANLEDTTYVGEASVMYFYSKVAIERIASFNPDAKILIFLRNYPKFLVSYHSQLYLMHEEDVADFATAWRLQQDRRHGKSIPKTSRESSFLQYREVAKFGEQLARVKMCFPDEQIKVILFEEWTKDPSKTYAEILEFLGLENDGFSEFNPVNTKREDSNRWLGRVLNRPPGFVLAIATFIRSILGLKRLGLAQKLMKLNQKGKASHSEIPEKLASEIVESLSDDRKQLEKLLGRPLDSWDQNPKSGGGFVQ